MKRRNFVCSACGRVETLSFWPDCCSSCSGSVYPEQRLDDDGLFMPFHDSFEPLEPAPADGDAALVAA